MAQSPYSYATPGQGFGGAQNSATGGFGGSAGPGFGGPNFNSGGTLSAFPSLPPPSTDNIASSGSNTMAAVAIAGSLAAVAGMGGAAFMGDRRLRAMQITIDELNRVVTQLSTDLLTVQRDHAHLKATSEAQINALRRDLSTANATLNQLPQIGRMETLEHNHHQHSLHLQAENARLLASQADAHKDLRFLVKALNEAQIPIADLPSVRKSKKKSGRRPKKQDKRQVDSSSDDADSSQDSVSSSSTETSSADDNQGRRDKKSKKGKGKKDKNGRGKGRPLQPSPKSSLQASSTHTQPTYHNQITSTQHAQPQYVPTGHQQLQSTALPGQYQRGSAVGAESSAVSLAAQAQTMAQQQGRAPSQRNQGQLARSVHHPTQISSPHQFHDHAGQSTHGQLSYGGGGTRRRSGSTDSAGSLDGDDFDLLRNAEDE